MCAFQQPSYPVYWKRQPRQRRPADYNAEAVEAEAPAVKLPVAGESEDAESPGGERVPEVQRDIVSARDITILRREFEGRYDALAAAAARGAMVVLAMEGQADILEETCERIVTSVDEAGRVSRSISASADELSEIAERLAREAREAVDAAKATKAEMDRLNGRSLGIVHRVLLLVVWLVSLIPKGKKEAPVRQKKVVFAGEQVPCK